MRIHISPGLGFMLAGAILLSGIIAFSSLMGEGFRAQVGGNPGTLIDADGMQTFMQCFGDDDCKIVYIRTPFSGIPKLMFVDCDDSTCTERTVTTIKELAFVPSTMAMNCGDANHCSIAYGDYENNAYKLQYVYCTNATCSTQTFSGLALPGVDRSLDMDCPTSTQCNLLMMVGSDVRVINCASGICSFGGFQRNQNNIGRISCPTISSCRISSPPQTQGGNNYFICQNTACSVYEELRLSVAGDVDCLNDDECIIVSRTMSDPKQYAYCANKSCQNLTYKTLFEAQDPFVRIDGVNMYTTQKNYINCYEGSCPSPSVYYLTIDNHGDFDISCTSTESCYLAYVQSGYKVYFYTCIGGNCPVASSSSSSQMGCPEYGPPPAGCTYSCSMNGGCNICEPVCPASSSSSSSAQSSSENASCSSQPSSAPNGCSLFCPVTLPGECPVCYFLCPSSSSSSSVSSAATSSSAASSASSGGASSSSALSSSALSSSSSSSKSSSSFSSAFTSSAISSSAAPASSFASAAEAAVSSSSVKLAVASSKAASSAARSVAPVPTPLPLSSAAPATVQKPASSAATIRQEVAAVSNPVCGNGRLEAFEECDDGNRNDNDGCSGSCRREQPVPMPQQTQEPTLSAPTPRPAAPAAPVPAPVQTPATQQAASSAASAQLLAAAPAPRCGDGTLGLMEECDDGNATNGDGCSDICRKERCGNGRRDFGEACDLGAQNSNFPDEFCRPDCTLGRCGDGIVDSVEECDDRNLMNGDGCSAVCRKEALPTQTLPASVLDLPMTVPSVSTLTQPSQAAMQQEIQRQTLTRAAAPQVPGTGPESLLVMAGGAAAGWAWLRRRRGA